MDAMLHRRTLRHGRTASTQKPKLTRLASFRKRQEKNDSSLQTPRAAARVVEGRGRGTAAARETLPRTNTFGCTRLLTTARNFGRRAASSRRASRGRGRGTAAARETRPRTETCSATFALGDESAGGAPARPRSVWGSGQWCRGAFVRGRARDTRPRNGPRRRRRRRARDASANETRSPARDGERSQGTSTG